jgi:hypothetical protein
MTEEEGLSLPASLQSRVVALARGEQQDTVALTAVQAACGITPPLVHFASWVLPANGKHSPPYSVEEENLFARLQCCYHKATGRTDKMKLFKLSPLLTPQLQRALTGDRQPQPDLTVNAASEEEAEARARRAEALLLDLEEKEKRPTSKAVARGSGMQNEKAGGRKKRGSNQQQQQRATAPSAATATAGSALDSLGGAEMSLEELSAPRGTPIDEDDGEGTWTPVVKGRRTTREVGAGAGAAAAASALPRAQQASGRGGVGRAASPANPITSTGSGATSALQGGPDMGDGRGAGTDTGTDCARNERRSRGRVAALREQSSSSGRG